MHIVDLGYSKFKLILVVECVTDSSSTADNQVSLIRAKSAVNSGMFSEDAVSDNRTRLRPRSLRDCFLGGHSLTDRLWVTGLTLFSCEGRRSRFQG